MNAFVFKNYEAPQSSCTVLYPHYTAEKTLDETRIAHESSHLYPEGMAPEVYYPRETSWVMNYPRIIHTWGPFRVCVLRDYFSREVREKCTIVATRKILA